MEYTVDLRILIMTIYFQQPVFAIDFYYICGVKDNQKKRMEEHQQFIKL